MSVRALSGLGLAAKIALGAGLAAASVAGAAAFDAVPDVIQEPARAVVSGVVDLVTPGRSAQQEPTPPDEGADDPAHGAGRPDELAGNGPAVPPTPQGTRGPAQNPRNPDAGSSADPGSPPPFETAPPGIGSDSPGLGVGRPEVPGKPTDPGASSAVPSARPTPPGQSDAGGRLGG